ncbi:conserved exported hypothetical protein [Tenacibaculum sediminilitoris]|uniref:GLPGLI family protein n=1 Tax=Tenacibaculum sediminilitoris TaxID=1820334 RepID=UPI003894AE4A
MMKKINLFIFLALFSIQIFSQNNNGKLVYSAYLNQASFNKNISKSKNNKVKELIESQGKRKYLLLFNQFESIFKQDEKLKNENYKGKIDLVSIFVGKGSYYYNLKTKELLNQKEVMGENFVVECDSDYNWVFIQETRKIGNFLCHKAVTTKTIKTKKGDYKEKPIVAWYTYDVPISFGIKDFQGLPGATVLLNGYTITYSLIEVKLNSLDKVDIKKPNRGKKITEKELDQHLRENSFKGF